MTQIRQLVMLHYSIPPVVGGVEFMLEPLAQLFAKNGWYVSMLTGKGNINNKNIKTTNIPELFPGNPYVKNMQKMLTSGSLPENYELAVTNFEKKLVTHIGDIENIIIHNMMTMPFNLVATEALHNYINNNPHKNFYVWIHDMAWLMEDYKQNLFNRKPWSILRTASKNVTYITISRFRKKQAVKLLELPPNKIEIIPNGINLTGFLNLHDSTHQFLNRLSAEQISKMILVPVRILPRKNLNRTIDIIGALAARDTNITAVIAGSPDFSDPVSIDYYTTIKEYVKDRQLEKNILFLHEIVEDIQIGEVGNRQMVHDLFQISMMVMLLSKDEGFGMPLLEAGIVKTPLVLSELEVFQEISGDNAIYISDLEPVKESADKIYEEILANPQKNQRMFGKIMKNFTWDSIWNTYIQKIFK